MNKFAVSIALTALALSAPAFAANTVTINAGKCVSVAIADGGCYFDGNITTNASVVASVQSQYNGLLPLRPFAPITLTPLFQSDDADFPGSLTFTGMGEKSGTFSTPGFLIDFFAVKAGTDSILYKMDTAASTGSWSTFGLLVGKGNQPDLSHLTFFGRADDGPADPAGVPEPSSWAMLIAGFGLVGAVARRRKGGLAVTA